MPEQRNESSAAQGHVASPLGVLDDVVAMYAPSHVFALFSGGDDSLTSTAIAARHPSFTAAVHVNTGIGIEATHEFVRETCKREGWPLLEYEPPTSYREIVMEHGFPGPGAHPITYVRLKERCFDTLVRDHKTGRRTKVVLVTGARSQESRRRMGHVEPIQPEPESVKVWVAPIHNWTKRDCLAFLADAGLPRNPVVELLHMSGECLCGSYANAVAERPLIAALCPEIEETISALERDVREAGVRACEWGKRPPPGHPDQMQLLDAVTMHACRCDLRTAV